MTYYILAYLVLGVYFAEKAYQVNKKQFGSSATLLARYKKYILRPTYVFLVLLWPILLLVACYVLLVVEIQKRKR